MKKSIPIILLLSAMSIYSFAQEKGFYIKPTGGYFIKVTPVEFPAINGAPARDRTTTITGTGAGASTTFSESALTGSFGQGFRAGLVGGYQFNNILGLELGVNYFNSAEQDMMKQNVWNNGVNVLSVHTVGKVRALDLAPALVFRIPSRVSSNPILKLG